MQALNTKTKAKHLVLQTTLEPKLQTTKIGTKRVLVF
jgi:hypothetical protein